MIVEEFASWIHKGVISIKRLGASGHFLFREPDTTIGFRCRRLRNLTPNIVYKGRIRVFQVEMHILTTNNYYTCLIFSVQMELNSPSGTGL